MGDELVFGSCTKAHAIQLIGDCAHDDIFPVEEAEEMKRDVRYAPTYPFVAAMRILDPYCLLTWPTLPSSRWWFYSVQIAACSSNCPRKCHEKCSCSQAFIILVYGKVSLLKKCIIIPWNDLPFNESMMNSMDKWPISWNDGALHKMVMHSLDWW